MEKQKIYVPKKEFWTYCIGAGGQGMVYGIMSSYISDFYLNVLGAAPLFVLLLMLLARVWDAINDPMMGMVMDRVHPKKGKMKAYLLYTPLPIAILTMCLFIHPGLSGTALMVYAAVTYTLWGMVYTVSDVPFWSLPNAMTANPAERGKLISVARTVNGVGSAIPQAMFMALGPLLTMLTSRSGVELEKLKYFVIVLVAAVIGNILFFRTYFGVKERVQVPDPPKREPGEPGALKLLFTCKPLMLVVAMGVLSSGRYLFQAGAVHVARYSFYLGPDLVGMTLAQREAALQSSISLVQLVFTATTALGMFGTMLIVPSLIKKFSYKRIIIVSCIIGGASSLAMTLIGYQNIWACAPLLVISSMPLGTINVLSSAMVGDSLDYMEWKTGVRQNGLGNACQSFVNKLGNALATSAIILTYILVRLDVNTIGAAYTPDPAALDVGVRSGMFSLVSLVPAISLLLCMIPLFFYDLTGEKKEKITQELQQQRIQKGIVVE